MNGYRLRGGGARGGRVIGESCSIGVINEIYYYGVGGRRGMGNGKWERF